MCAPKAPTPPDPAKLAQAQGAANKETAIAQAILNMVNQRTPFGTLEFSQRGEVDGVPQFTATTKLSPQQQVIHARTQQLQGRHLNLAQDQLGRTAHHLKGRLNLHNAPGVRKARLPQGRLSAMPNAQSVPSFRGLPGFFGIPGNINRGALPGGGNVPGMPRQGALPKRTALPNVPGLSGLPQGGSVPTVPQGGLPSLMNVPGAPNQRALPGRGNIPGLPSLEGLPEAPEANDAVRQRTEDAMFQRAKAQLDPVFQDRQRQLETQLVNQGFARGSEAYNRELERFRQGESDAYQSALQDAIMFGGQEQSRLFGLESQARQQAFGERADLFGMDADRFGMGMAGREQGLREQAQQFGIDANRFGMRQSARDQLFGEQAARFGMGAQQFGMSEAQRQRAFGERQSQFGMGIDRFGASMAGREQGLREQAQQFGMGAQRFGMGEQQRGARLAEQLARFQTGAERFGMSAAQRQQAMGEILNRFGMGQSVFDQGMRQRQQGVSEQGQRFGQEAQLFGMDQQARQQAIQEMVLRRAQPLNEMATLMGQAPQVGMPQFAQVPQTGIGGTDVMGAHALNFQGQQNAFNAQQQRQQGLFGALGNIAGTALGGWASGGFALPAFLSDPESKEGREPVEPEAALEGMRKVPVEQWNYKGDPQRRVGPMADRWAGQFGGDGKTIDPVSAFGLSMGAIQALADKVERMERAS